ncbi:MAG: YraN family protein [Desulfocapsaceae bacterium]|nr:YraN family protein [Desulfocapsaceae bacterium]
MTERSGRFGRSGEEIAAAYLQREGYRILQRNYRQKCGEIDIIASDRGTLVFVEVKTRKDAAFGTPFEAVTRKKQRQIGRVAQEYLGRNNLFNTPARFDVVSILMRGDEPPVIELLANAFDLI